MIIRKLAQILCALTLFAACLLGQTVSSGLQGTVMDPANAVVPGATVTLTNIERLLGDNDGEEETDED